MNPADFGMQRHPEGGWYETWQHRQTEPAADQSVLVACIVSPGFDFADFTLAE